ncbi:ArnT family glycosyltransferase [Formosa algae]|uniref:ArnT family glycosyltransferase n=1 Tax=Formosa algae TaxID=225843 RepID=UPI000CCFBD29|nr:glycosyltransferase family 39 protein [Formosa algae]PNW26424.1 glycosyl transferase [Formosa algae]
MTKKAFILVGFIILKFVLQYTLISPEYDLQRDEYLHLDLGQHLEWGYLSVPPLTSWISRIIYLLGNSVFWVKCFPALFGALTLLVVWKAIEALKGNLFALILGATGVLFSCLLSLNTLYQPNSFDVLSWTTFFYIVIKYFNSENPKWLFVAALVFALGFLNKYNIVFLLLGFLPAILLTKQRNVFLQKKLYYAVFLGLLLISPNLLWQYTNNFPVINHLKELSDTQLKHMNQFDFIQSQILFFIGSLLVIISALYALLFYKPFKKYRAFFWAFFFTLTLFMSFKAKDYYAIGLYPIYISFGSVFLATLLNTGWKRYLQPIAIAMPVCFFIPMYNVAFPNKSPEYIVKHSNSYKALGLLRWEDGTDHAIPQDYADMLGWKELAKKVDAVYGTLPNPKQTLIICDNYGQAGAINYYTKQGIKAVSFNADYVNWFNLDQQYTNLIRVKNYQEKDSEIEETSPYFESSSIADSITNPYAREFRTLIFAFSGAKIDMNERIQYEIDEVKNNH